MTVTELKDLSQGLHVTNPYLAAMVLRDGVAGLGDVERDFPAAVVEKIKRLRVISELADAVLVRRLQDEASTTVS